MIKLINAYDFGVERLCDWPALLAQHPSVPGARDYADGRRVTLRCRLAAPNNPDLPAAPPRVQNALPATHTELEMSAGTTTADGTRPRWRDAVNRGLSRATGYHLTRSGR